MYWIYDIPNWQLCLLIMVTFSGAATFGLSITRPLVGRIVNESGKHNDVTSYILAGVGVLYGLTLGLIAVGTWQNFTDADSKVSKEANSLGALYRDLDGYPSELRYKAERLLRDYVLVVITKEWPAHRQGKVVDAGDLVLEDFENRIMAFEPTSETTRIAHGEVIKSLNEVVQNRGYRMQSVNTALPIVLWAVVLMGAVVNVGLTYLFWVENTRLHALLVVAFASTLGMLIFLTAAMDNPYRGEFSVNTDAYQYIVDHVMTRADGSTSPENSRVSWAPVNPQ
jgi:hypothetical protein